MNAWTELEFDILETMTRRIKLMTHHQFIQTFPQTVTIEAHQPSPSTRLLRTDLLLTTTTNVRPTAEVPLAEWEPGSESPDFDSVWQQLRERREQATVPTRVYWAGPQAANLFGVKGGVLSPMSERNSDLRLAAAYVKHHRLGLNSRWLGPLMIRKAVDDACRADAVILGTDGGVQRAILVVPGDFQRLRDFHKACVRTATAYAVW